MSASEAEFHIADSQDPEAVCPGGFSLASCKAAARLRKQNRNFRPADHLTAMDELVHFNHLVDKSVGCLACGYTCTIKLEMFQRRQTGRYQVVYVPTNA